MAEYRINIITSAQTAGLDQTQQATKGLTQSTRDLNAELTKATQQFRDAQNPAVAAAGANKKLADAMGGANDKASNLLQGLKKVGNVIPGFQFGLASLTNVWTLLAAAIVGTVGKLREWDEIVQKNEARIKVFRDLNKEVDRFRTNIQEAKREFVEFNREFEKATTDATTPSDEGEAAAAKARAGFSAQRARVTEGKNLKLAQIDAAEAAGRITPAQAAQQKLALGVATDKQLGGIDLAEKKELSDIKLLVAGTERFRADEARRAFPAAQAAQTAAKNTLADRQRALQAAQEFGGFDAEGKPVAGGRAAQLDEQIRNLKVFSLTPNSAEYKRRRAALIQERTALEQGVGFARSGVEQAQLGFDEASANVAQIRSTALSAGTSAVSLRRQGLAEAGEFSQAAALQGEVNQMRAATAAEQSNAVSLKEAAKLQEESAKQLAQVVKSLGDGLGEIGGLRRQVEYLLNQTKTNAASQ